jgi:hypothetical protein
MYAAQTYGYLNDYAMTFQMNNDADRGWLWRHESMAASDGAMSLTTDGRVQIKNLLNVPSVYADRYYDRNNTGFYLDPASTSYLNDVRADVFYDRNNTGYYGNFASTSRMNRVDMNDARADIFYDRSNTAYYADFASTSNMNVVNVQSLGVNGSAVTYDGAVMRFTV